MGSNIKRPLISPDYLADKRAPTNGLMAEITGGTPPPPSPINKGTREQGNKGTREGAHPPTLNGTLNEIEEGISTPTLPGVDLQALVAMLAPMLRQGNPPPPKGTSEPVNIPVSKPPKAPTHKSTNSDLPKGQFTHTCEGVEECAFLGSVNELFVDRMPLGAGAKTTMEVKPETLRLLNMHAAKYGSSIRRLVNALLETYLRVVVQGDDDGQA